MTDRDALIEAGARALIRAETAGLCTYGETCPDCDCFADTAPALADRDGYARDHAAAMIDAVERLIRADERERIKRIIHTLAAPKVAYGYLVGALPIRDLLDAIDRDPREVGRADL